MSRNRGRAYRTIQGISGAGRALRAGCVLAMASATLLAGAPARGSAPADAAPSAAILITFDPESAEQGPVVAAVKAHLRGVPVRVLAEPLVKARSVGQKVATSGELATASGAIGTLSVELAEDDAVLIFFTEPDGSATLIRRLPANEQGVRTTVEQVAIVVRSLVEALLDGGRVGLSPDARPSSHATRSVTQEKKTKNRASPTAKRGVPRPARSAQRKPAEAPNTVEDPFDFELEIRDGPGTQVPASRTVAMTAAYAGALFATNAGWQSGFALGARWLARAPLYGAARYTFVPELEGGSGETSVSVARHPVELAVGYLGKTPVAGNAELGLVTDYTRRRTRSNAPGFAPTPARGRWMVAVGARAGVSWSVMEALALTLRGGADFLLTRYSYVAPPGSPVASPRLVRPRLDLELAVSLW